MSWKSIVNRAVKIGVREGMKYLRESQTKNKQSGNGPADRSGGQGSGRGPGQQGSEQPRRGGSRPDSPRPQGQRPADASPASADYPGDYRGQVTVTYAPDLDGNADPGEVVWGWIPFEEDHSQGKDRPSLVIGKDGEWVLVLMLTSKDHIPGGVGEVRSDGGARWMNIGTGDWDSQGRPSEIRLDRVIRLDPDGIRREGAVMSREIFSLVAAEFEAR